MILLDTKVVPTKTKEKRGIEWTSEAGQALPDLFAGLLASRARRTNHIPHYVQCWFEGSRSLICQLLQVPSFDYGVDQCLMLTVPLRAARGRHWTTPFVPSFPPLTSEEVFTAKEIFSLRRPIYYFLKHHCGHNPDMSVIYCLGWR